jgi:hypothetical protein
MTATNPLFQGSLDDSGTETENKVLVSMSTTFYPREDHPSDLIIITADSVFFSVHKRILLSKSQNFFGGLLQPEDTQSFTGRLTNVFPFARRFDMSL